MHYEFAGFADKGELMPLKILTSDGQVVRPEIGGGDPSEAFVHEIAEVIKCSEANQPSATLSGDLARDAIILCHKQTEAVKAGKVVEI
jgi:hypothetical protein